jgi:lipopolysaccharide/colanic/teichoic acid biosynthesis glycosyltransferase
MNQDEQSIEFPGQLRSRFHWERHASFDHDAATSARPQQYVDPRTSSGWRDAGVTGSPNGSRVALRLFKNVAVKARVRHESHSPYACEILSKSQFLTHLRLEKLRTQRSRAPLSIVLFHFERSDGDELCNIKGLLDILRNGKREVDIPGYLDDDLVAIVLPDTGRLGARAFLQKFTTRFDDLPCTATTATYPDHLFEELTRGNQGALNQISSLFQDFTDSPSVGYFLKRGIDVIGASVAILLFAPLMVITAVAIKLTSQGPVVFKQTRLGYRGVPFDFYKFRSMSLNADDRVHREYVASLINGNHAAINQGNAAKPMYKLKSDPRVTPVGRIIRKSSMDELPQLFNVLKGDMSLVGPRPPLPYEAKQYQPWHLRRILGTKPGITGLWQVEGRSKVCFDDMVRMDLRYIRNCSLIFDLKILVKTLVVVLKREGAG